MSDAEHLTDIARQSVKVFYERKLKGALEEAASKGWHGYNLHKYPSFTLLEELLVSKGFTVEASPYPVYMIIRWHKKEVTE